MWEDPIVKETRAVREQLLEQFDYDLDALCEYLEENVEIGKPVVTLEPRRPTEPVRKIS
jgi:hypothetical protein